MTNWIFVGIGAVEIAHRKKVQDCCNEVNRIIQLDEFHSMLKDMGPFDFSSGSADNVIDGEEILRVIAESVDTAIVQTYRPRWPRHRNVNAYVSRKHPADIYLNAKKLWRPYVSVFETIFHELIHSLQFLDGHDWDYGHGDNSAAHKDGSAPRAIPKLASDFLSPEFLRKCKAPTPRPQKLTLWGRVRRMLLRF